ncbi:MAG: DNA primase [Candidatus Caenarcaniphilales bacterium]|nr:DNA primase [Candidatus Caenarcaniphilales bacterium]
MADPISQIKDKADIVELIADHIPVKKSGAGYVAVCPFHNDTKPSMQISPQKGIFKCFSCGAGGDVFKFWSEFHKKDFSETLKDLALRYGVHLDYSEEAKSKQKIQADYVSVYNEAAKYFHEKLLGADAAKWCRDYLEARGIDLNTIKSFQIGFSPTSKDDWTHLLTHLKKKLDLDDKKLFDFGLAIHHEKSGRYYDRFRERLMIPVANERGDILAFGARKLNNEDESPKYINSPETDFYHKGDNLYGLNLAKNPIRQKDSVILVEGYFDQIALYKSGITNVVANQGTALTAKQAKLLMKFTPSKNIYLCLDADAAGENAKEKAFEQIMQISISLNPAIKVIDMSAKDPDEYIAANGVEAFQALIDNAKYFIDYKIDKYIEELNSETSSNKDPRAKSIIVKKIARFLYFVSNKIEFTEYVHNLSEKLKIDQRIVAEQVQSEIKLHSNDFQDFEKQKSSNKKSSNSMKNKKSSLEKDVFYGLDVELMALLINDIKLLEEFMAEEHQLACEEHFEILDSLVEVSFENPEANVDEKFKKLSALPLIHEMKFESLLADIGVEIESNKKQFKSRFHELIRAIKKLKIKNKITRKINAIKKLEENLDSSDDEIFELQNELIHLNREFAAI